MTTWDYKVLVLPASNYDVDEEILGIHGEKQWELVTVILDKSNYRVCYFKRPAEEAGREKEDATKGMRAVKLP